MTVFLASYISQLLSPVVDQQDPTHVLDGVLVMLRRMYA